MQVLLTGATGDVGRGVRQILIKYNISTISVSSKFQKKQDFIQWDLTKTAPANKIDTKFNAIVSLVDGEKQITNIVAFAVKQKVKLFVYMSSIASLFPWICAYAKLKNETENKVIRMCNKHNIKCVVIRPPVVIDNGNRWDIYLKQKWWLSPFVRLYAVHSYDVGEAVFKALRSHTHKRQILDEKHCPQMERLYRTVFISSAVIFLLHKIEWRFTDDIQTACSGTDAWQCDFPWIIVTHKPWTKTIGTIVVAIYTAIAYVIISIVLFCYKRQDRMTYKAIFHGYSIIWLTWAYFEAHHAHQDKMNRGLIFADIFTKFTYMIYLPTYVSMLF